MTTTTATKTCECGCGEPVARRFRPGHDAKAKAALLNDTRSSAWWVREAAIATLVTNNWGHFIDAEILGTVPVRSRFNGRFTTTRHIDQIQFAVMDSEDFTHSVWSCPRIKGETRRAEKPEGWCCSTCIHTQTVAEEVWSKRSYTVDVMEDTETAA